MQQQSIAVGIVFNEHQQVLISKRDGKQSLTGYWEFPGGKVEPGESFKRALRRELAEEIGIKLGSAIKLIETHYQYPDLELHFQFYKITHYSGEVVAKERQQIRWASCDELNSIKFPAANQAVINAILLPYQYMIADEHVSGSNLFTHVDQQLKQGIKLIQHRAGTDAYKNDYLQHARQIKSLCAQYNAKYIVNCPLDWLDDIKPDAIHLNSRCLNDIKFDDSREIGYEYFSASCHDEQEVDLANRLGVSCVLIGPVNVTKSHPTQAALGWKKFSELCFMANMPVYALGGMHNNDYKVAQIYGAQGIAAIRAFI